MKPQQLLIITFCLETENQLVDFITSLTCDPYLFLGNPSINLLTNNPFYAKNEPDIKSILEFPQRDIILLIAENVKEGVLQICEDFTFLEKINEQHTLEKTQKQELTELIAKKFEVPFEKINLNEVIVFNYKKEEEDSEISLSTGDIVSSLLSSNCEEKKSVRNTIIQGLPEKNYSYRLEERLETNSGEFACEVWEATNQVLTCEKQLILFVAQNFLNRLEEKEGLLTSLVKQIRQSASNRIPGIIVPTDLGCISDYVFLVTEPISGISLDTLVGKNREGLSVEEVRPCLEALKKILVQLHEQGRMRLEFLRPTNIFYDHDNKTVALVDWQIPLSTQERDSYKSYETLLDEKGLAKNVADPADDVYSLAAITYQLLSGKHPFAGEIATEAKSQEKNPAFLNNLNQRQWEALTKGLDFERKERTQSISEFLKSFLNKTLYNFIKQMVEAPFFVGLVMGGMFLNFTVGYLYFGSGGVSRLEYRQIREKIEQSGTFEEAESWIKRIASQNERTEELEKLLKTCPLVSSTSQNETVRELNMLSNSFIKIADDVSSGGVWGKMTCNSEAAKLVAYSIEKVVDIDSWLISQKISGKINRDWVEQKLKELIELCKNYKNEKNKLENYKNTLDDKYLRK